MNGEWPWSSLEIARLVVGASTPIAVAVLGVYLTRIAKQFEHLQWRNQRLIDKRIGIYDDLAPHLNDLLCYFTFVGCWKDLDPPHVVAMKRLIDKKVYLAAPLFSEDFFQACSTFISLCFTTFLEWGRDATLRTPKNRRKQVAAANWREDWDACFSDNPSDPADIRKAYQEVMSAFSRNIGLTTDHQKLPLGQYPDNIN